MNITVLGGGVGGGKFLLGMRAALAGTGARLRAVVNTGDDMWLAGLRITPDLDSIMYALAGVNDTERGWGRAGESERVSAELAAWGVGWPWFTLGDLDLGAHISRTSWLREGVPLTEVVRRLSARWPLGAELIPATDDEVETHVLLEDGRELHFQEWWTRHRAALPVQRFIQRGLEHSSAAPAALDAIGGADLIVLAPSNPVVSIGTIVAIPGMRQALLAAPAPIVGVSPIIGGAVVRGMADQCLTALGVETSAGAVARHYGARSAGGLLDGWLVDEVDAGAVDDLTAAGIPTRAVPLWMRDEDSSAAIARHARELGGLPS
ncbi:MAG TPA: 2-phospho-L-lactate transferase [Pseudolysinimonas sp.]|nr:2-phospho-L-lactate transferase [Pseudolysinimonas sp.]